MLLKSLKDEEVWYNEGDIAEYIAAADLLGFEYDYCETDKNIEFAAWYPDEPGKSALFRLGRKIDASD
ncbi:hypothetical protein [Gloeothece verrucosa]|uniref:TonB-dependent receptor n=1 Tax=Gloeothece verrucosa (strain PCC 7822) TaxID=497965 RepID=E0UNJ7_GLOV7|nr:hypothetical protein [Gloeothece verrucosa]ADN18527.1 TonB-dependent receptor [Gloeothece verrucosa PCC 7822]